MQHAKMGGNKANSLNSLVQPTQINKEGKMHLENSSPAKSTSRY